MIKRSIIIGSALIVFSVTVFVGPSGAAAPTRTGSASCAFSGDVRFPKHLVSAVRNGPHFQPRPDTDARAHFAGSGAACSGTQTGGRVRRPGPIDQARLRANGIITGHTCSDLTAHGIHAIKTRITWLDAAGRSLGTSKIDAATATVAGLGNGSPPSFPPPNTPPPGIITFTFSGTIRSDSTVFPSRTFTATFIADERVENFALPCAPVGPPVDTDMAHLTFTGVNGPSTFSVS
jgi:hypothetical protein